jgi:uncharacterized protein with HEPN domain
MSNKLICEWHFYIDDMIRFSQKVIRYTHNHDQTSFIEDELHYDATLRNIELIGDAATNISPEIRKDNLEIPWRQIIATRTVSFMDIWALMIMLFGVLLLKKSLIFWTYYKSLGLK